MAIREEPLFCRDGKEFPVHCILMEISGGEEPALPSLHNHRYTEFLFGISGEAKVFIGNRVYTMTKGDLAIVQEKEGHDVAAVSGGTARYYVIKILPELFRGGGSDSALLRLDMPLWRTANRIPAFIPASTLGGTDLDALMAEVWQEWQDGKSGYLHIIQADVVKMIAKVLRLFAPADEDAPSLSPALLSALGTVLDALPAHLADWSARDAADCAGLSYPYFCRCFKRAYGISYTAYRETVQLREAENRILRTGEPITGIALSLGFSTSSYFISRFKEKYGVTPTRYRKMAGKR